MKRGQKTVFSTGQTGEVAGCLEEIPTIFTTLEWPMMLCSKWKWAVLGGGRHCIIVVTTFLQHHRSNNVNGCIDTPSLMKIEATIWATICHSKALGAGCLEEITTIFTTLEWPTM